MEEISFARAVIYRVVHVILDAIHAPEGLYESHLFALQKRVL